MNCARLLWLGALWPIGLIPVASSPPVLDNDSSEVIQDKAYANEPAEFIRLAELHFDEYGEAGWKDLSDDPEFEIVRTSSYIPEKSGISSVPAPPDDDWIGVAKFFPHQTRGTAPINYILPHDSAWNSEQYNELFWGFWFMVSENHTVVGGNKIGFVEIGDSTATAGKSAIYFRLSASGTQQDSFRYAILTQGKPTETFGGVWTCDLGRVIKAGQWHKLEHYAKLNSVTGEDSLVKDGRFKVWVDETLCVDEDTIAFRGLPSDQPPHRVFSRIKWNPTYRDIPPDTSYQFMSHFYVSGKRSD